jgi:glycosyltransferase involved in cell wall biosynthesis
MRSGRVTAGCLSVVVPVFRNGETLEPLYRRLDAAISDEFDVQFVFVDDASPDASSDVLSFLATRDARVEVVRHAVNAGQHRAVLTGLRACRGEWTVIIDADLQDPPEAVPIMLDHLRSTGAEVVFGTRRGRYQGRARTITGRGFRRVLAALVDLPPGAGMFCVLEADLVRRVLALRGPEPAIVAMIGCARPRTGSVPIERSRRPVGRSAYSSAARLRSAWRAFRWAARSRRTLETETT